MKLWIAAAQDPAHRNGGWAFVREAPIGWAGGERRTTRARMALAVLAIAVRDLAADTPLSVIAARPDALVLHGLLKAPAEPPTDDLDLRAELAKALSSRTWTLALGDPAGLTPLKFAAAWADLAAEKAKMGGAFVAAIPRTNLAKVEGL